MIYCSDGLSERGMLRGGTIVAAATFFAAIAVVGCDPAVEHSALKTTAATANSASSANVGGLRERIDAVLLHTLHERELRLDTHAAWQIVHGVVAFGPQFPVTSANGRVTALDWAFAGNSMKGWTMRPAAYGVEAVLEPGTKEGQGHPDQWLGYMALWEIPSSTPLVVGGRDYQIKDLVTQAMMDVREGKEASWTLMALSTYLEPDQDWQARDGSTWTLDRLIGMEAGADLPDQAARDQINSAACGGSHRLVGLTHALAMRRERLPDAPLTGGWEAADRRVRWAAEQARKFQLPNGGFSVHYFARPSSSPDLAEHLGATGHTLEFLCRTLDDQELAEQWVARAADYLCGIFEKTESVDLECGALYHAARGLSLYRERVFGPRDYFENSQGKAAGEQARTADARS